MTILPRVDDENKIRQLDIRDAESGFQLSSAAGWNQTVADWQMMLSAGEAFGLFMGGKLVGSALYLPFPPDVAWVSMVLVDDAHRRRGIGSRLTTQCVQRIEERGLVPFLDATEAGRAVYSRMGFQDGPSISRLVAAEVGSLQRLRSPSAEMSNAMPHRLSGQAEELRCVPCTDLDLCDSLDAAALGGKRNQILANIAGRGDDTCVVVTDAKGPAGFGMLRRGRAATQIGPVVVRSDLVDSPAFVPVATSILAELAGRTEGPVIADIPDRHRAIRALLEAAGFEAQRRFVRMYRGAAVPPSHSALTLACTVAIGGPAIG